MRGLRRALLLLVGLHGRAACAPAGARFIRSYAPGSGALSEAMARASTPRTKGAPNARAIIERLQGGDRRRVQKRRKKRGEAPQEDGKRSRQRGPRLTSLELQRCYDTADQEAIAEALARNATLTSLDLNYFFADVGIGKG